MVAHIHILGGGLAGLSAATQLVSRNTRITVYEAAPSLGGRARSYYDSKLERRIDNGNHLILSGNEAALAYLDLIGSRDSLYSSGLPFFPFYDLADHKRWLLQLSSGRWPFWLFSPSRRVPNVSLKEYKAFFKLLQADSSATVGQCLVEGKLADRFLKPLAISALNTPVEVASAHLLASILRQTVMAGGRYCIPLFPKEGLSETFIQPAVVFLDFMSAEIRTSARVAGCEVDGSRVHAIHLASGEKILVEKNDIVISALPAWVASGVFGLNTPGFFAPDQFESIINMHYRLPKELVLHSDLAKSHFCGISGGMAEWVFVKKDIISVTVSAANQYNGLSLQDIETRVWAEVRHALDKGLDTPLPVSAPPSRLIWEKKATFAATPQQDSMRPKAQTSLSNLVLAGDWTNTGLPSTIEGSIRSGVTAADVVSRILFNSREHSAIR